MNDETSLYLKKGGIQKVFMIQLRQCHDERYEINTASWPLGGKLKVRTLIKAETAKCAAAHYESIISGLLSKHYQAGNAYPDFQFSQFPDSIKIGDTTIRF